MGGTCVGDGARPRAARRPALGRVPDARARPGRPGVDGRCGRSGRGRARRGRGARQQRRILAVGRVRGRPDGACAGSVRDERLRAGRADTARAPRDATATGREDREPELDGRAARVSGRGVLPRDQARGRGPERRPPLRGARLRHPRCRDRARPHPKRLRRRGGGVDRVPAGGRERVRRLQRRGGEGHARVVRAGPDGPARRRAGSPDDVARAIEKALAARRPKPRVKVAVSARLLLAQRRWSSDRAWDWFLRQGFPSPGTEKRD